MESSRSAEREAAPPAREQPEAEKDRAPIVLFIFGPREARVVDVSSSPP